MSGRHFKLVKRPLPEFAANQIRIKVAACEACHRDSIVQEGVAVFSVPYAQVPGHEVVGVIDKLGKGVKKWRIGQRVGVGWHGGHCFVCDLCRCGDFMNCENERDLL